jgi:hypothetical protein
MINKKGSEFSLVAIFLVVFALIIFGFLSFFVRNIGSSTGQHTGIITAVEHNNNLVWDANLVYFKSSDESTQEDIYCVNDLEVMDELEQYAKNKDIVTIYFHNDFIFWAWDCNGGISIIYEVKES